MSLTLCSAVFHYIVTACLWVLLTAFNYTCYIPSIERLCKSLPFSILQARKPEKRDDLISGGVYHEEVSHILHKFCQWCPCPKRNSREHKKPYLQLLQLYARNQPGNTYLLNVYRTCLSWDQVDFFFFFLRVYFLAFTGFIDRTAEGTTVNRMRERGSDTRQRAPGWDSNPGLLQRAKPLYMGCLFYQLS